MKRRLYVSRAAMFVSILDQIGCGAGGYALGVGASVGYMTPVAKWFVAITIVTWIVRVVLASNLEEIEIG